MGQVRPVIDTTQTRATVDTNTETRTLKHPNTYRTDILHRINELTRPITTHNTQPLGYHKSYDQPQTVKHPPLLDQLTASITGTTGHGGTTGGNGFTSKPAARISALDTHTRIEQETRQWVIGLGGTPRATAPGNLWWLAGATPNLDTHTLADLDTDTRSWHAGASITSGWDAPAWRPHVTCINCNDKDTIRIRIEPILGYCVSCGQGWDAATIGILGNHVQLMLEQARTIILAGDHSHDGGSGRGLIANDTPHTIAGIRTDENGA